MGDANTLQRGMRSSRLLALGLAALLVTVNRHHAVYNEDTMVL